MASSFSFPVQTPCQRHCCRLLELTGDKPLRHLPSSTELPRGSVKTPWFSSTSPTPLSCLEPARIEFSPTAGPLLRRCPIFWWASTLAVISSIHLWLKFPPLRVKVHDPWKPATGRRKSLTVDHLRHPNQRTTTEPLPLPPRSFLHRASLITAPHRCYRRRDWSAAWSARQGWASLVPGRTNPLAVGLRAKMGPLAILVFLLIFQFF
jgi:hypothetical protein